MVGSDLMRVAASKQAKNMVRAWIRGTGLDITRVPYGTFHEKCLEAGLQAQCCEPFMRSLERTGTVVYAHGVVHLNPQIVFDGVQEHIGITQQQDYLDIDVRIAALEKELAVLDREKEDVDVLLESYRKKVWGRVAAYCGAQMWLFSRFTFVDFEWDIMEPVSWFVTQGNAVLFFAFLWIYGREHSHAVFDNVVLSRRMVKMYDSHGFDVQMWLEKTAELKELKLQRADGLNPL